MPEKVPSGKSLFLTDTDGKREDVKPSAKALKSIVRAPPNLAIYDSDGNLDPTVEHVLGVARNFSSAYQNQWSSLQQKWEKADNMYWMEQNPNRLSELTRAKVSDSTYHRTVRRLADGAYLATWQEDLPVKYFPDIGIFEDPSRKQDKAIIAEALNRVASYMIRKNGMKDKTRSSYNFVYRYGNHVAYTPWEFQIEKRKRYQDVNHNVPRQAPDGTTVFEHSRTGEMSLEPHNPETYEVEEDCVTHDELGFNPLKIDQILLDNRIDCLDRQTCLLHRADITRPELWAQGRAGTFKNLDKITGLQRFQQYNWQNQAELQRIRDSGKTSVDSYESEVYEHWRCWILLPKLDVKLNKKGEPTSIKWNQNAAERRYIMDVIGDLSGPVVVTRFSESPYWDDGVPYVDCHSHVDDSGWWHRGLMELLEDNMLQAQTAKGQLMDNRTLRNFRPMKRLVGRCRNRDMRITHNTIYDVTSPDAVEFFDIPDISQTIASTLEFIQKDSESVAQTPPFFMGEALGGRTSATEFASIRDQSSAPALNDIKTLEMQLIGGWMKKLKCYAPQFLDKDIAVEVAGQQGEKMLYMVRADEFATELSIEEVAVQEFENKATMRQILINLVQVISNPMFAPFINIGGFLERLFYTFRSVFPNPEEILNKDEATMAILRAYLAQLPPQGSEPNPAAPQNLLGPSAPNLNGPSGPGGPVLPWANKLGAGPLPTAGQNEAQPINAAMGAAKSA